MRQPSDCFHFIEAEKRVGGFFRWIIVREQTLVGNAAGGLRGEVDCRGRTSPGEKKCAKRNEKAASE